MVPPTNGELLSGPLCSQGKAGKWPLSASVERVCVALVSLRQDVPQTEWEAESETRPAPSSRIALFVPVC